MGNQPSGPAPPLAPVCDAECQRQKLLTGLKSTLDQKEETQAQDPEGYEQARIAYYTALYGDGWLATEKQRIAQDEISPKITAYTEQYNQLKQKQTSQQVFVNVMNGLQAQQESDEEDLNFLKKEYESKKDKADVLNRLTTLNQSTTPSTNYLPIILDVVLAILGLIILYLLYSKFDTIKGYFTTSSMNIGGKRASH